MQINKAVISNIQGSFKEFNLLKGGKKTGIYTNTAENRKKGIVGQKYSKDKEEVKEKHSIEEKEQIQEFVDIISLNPTLPRYQKYKDVLKEKYGIDYDKTYGNIDSNLIKNASLDGIKTKKDFIDFDNYLKYAVSIFKLRDLSSKQPKQIDKNLTYSNAEKVANKLGFNIKHREYSGEGNFAQVSVDLMELPSSFDVNTFIHELGHIYQNKHYKEGVASMNTNASSYYQIKLTNEVFAENFMHFFIAPDYLKENLPEVYRDLDSKINSNWKKEIRSLIE